MLNNLVFGLDVSTKNIGGCVLYNQKVIGFGVFEFQKKLKKFDIAERLFKSEIDHFILDLKQVVNKLPIMREKKGKDKETLLPIVKRGTEQTYACVGVEAFYKFSQKSNVKVSFALHIFLGAVIFAMRVVLDELFLYYLANTHIKTGTPTMWQREANIPKDNFLSTKERSVQQAVKWLVKKGCTEPNVLNKFVGSKQAHNTADAINIAVATEKGVKNAT